MRCSVSEARLLKSARMIGGGMTRKKSKPVRARIRRMSTDPRYALNALCPYFTMFPLEYPMRVLNHRQLRKYRSPLLCDPYCGRGTSLFAARMRGIRAHGIDVAPVAVAIAQAKLAATTPEAVPALFDDIMEENMSIRVPEGPTEHLGRGHPAPLLSRLRVSLAHPDQASCRDG